MLILFLDINVILVIAVLLLRFVFHSIVCTTLLVIYYSLHMILFLMISCDILIKQTRKRKFMSERVATRRIVTFGWRATGFPRPPSCTRLSRLAAGWSCDRICWPLLLGSSLTHWSMAVPPISLGCISVLVVVTTTSTAPSQSFALSIRSLINLRFIRGYCKMQGEKHAAKSGRSEKRRVSLMSRFILPS